MTLSKFQSYLHKIDTEYFYRSLIKATADFPPPYGSNG